jgi:hypothetical protein
LGLFPAVAAGGWIYPVEFCRMKHRIREQAPRRSSGRDRSAVEWRSTVGATGVALHLAREWGQSDEIHFVDTPPSRASALLQVLHRSTFRGQALKLWEAACWRRRWASRHPFHRHTAIAGKRAPTGFRGARAVCVRQQTCGSPDSQAPITKADPPRHPDALQSPPPAQPYQHPQPLPHP